MPRRPLRQLRRRVRRPQLALLVLVAALAIGYGVNASHQAERAPAIGSVALSTLPPQVEAAIRSLDGRPASGGASFSDAGRRLPAEAPDYYREYPLGTGQSQLVLGLGGQVYYSTDGGVHFEQVDLAR
ncbi:MAG TPA: ribonuclease domain-containing protein [Jatrophihabitantaceae bacterium]|jgi:hypothetical protein|nr:ribonuclease domain-containing protein [Jatrophihabitantaceae bacterium]